jgi:hypothetical protein
MWWRRSAVAIVALAVMAACTAEPAEVHTPANGTYPARPSAAPETVLALRGAPLIVDGRLRVFASKHEVAADGPVDVAPATPPYWSLRRNQVDLQGVVAVGKTVVSLWFDGELVAIDAQSGAISWRARTQPSAGGYAGRRTGAYTVYPLEDLYTAVTGAGRPVVLRSVDGQIWAFDIESGALLWHKVFEGSPNCRLHGFTTSSGEYLTVDACRNRAAIELYDVATGALARTWMYAGGQSEPSPFAAGCRVGRSECRAVVIPIPTSTPMRAWTFTVGDQVEAAGVTSLTARIVGTVAADSADPFGATWATEIVGRDVRTGRELWRWRAPISGARLVADQPHMFHVLTGDHELVSIDAMTGAVRSRVSLGSGDVKATWGTGNVYASDGFVVIERLGIGDPIAADDEYYFSDRPVLLAAT